MQTADESRQVRAARNQSLFREINERIQSLNETFGRLLPMGEWVCECADDACTEHMELTLEEYERIRRDANHFPVLPGHELPDVERVVERHERYLVVEKIGQAAAVARELDPRPAE
jgi:hypothetical protein